MKKKWGYLIADLVSLGLFEFGLYVALAWYWSKFQWSPFGYETCGLEFLRVLLITYPAFIIGLLIRFGLLFCWEVTYWAWDVPLLLCGIASCAFVKSLEMGIFCIAAMLVLPIVDFFGIKKAVRK
jgi:hypothetical protein